MYSSPVMGVREKKQEFAFLNRKKESLIRELRRKGGVTLEENTRHLKSEEKIAKEKRTPPVR